LYGVLQGRAIREDAEKRRISVTNRQRGYAACILARRGNHKAARRQKMTNILLGIIALELLAIFSKLDKLEERGRENE
jgi:hypothetical protein